MSEWISVKREKPPLYRNVLFAFEEHWNQVVGFRSGEDEYYETSAHDSNTKIAKPFPDWWMEIREVPHRIPRPDYSGAAYLETVTEEGCL